MEIKLSKLAYVALDFAYEASDKLKHGFVGTEHILLGISRFECAATLVLNNNGVNEEILEDAMSKLVSSGRTMTVVKPQKREDRLTRTAVLLLEAAAKEAKRTKNDNVGTMFNKLSDLGSKMIIDFLPKFLNGEITPIKQNVDEVTYAYNISKEDEKIDFNNNSKDIFNKIRGLNPFPVSYTLLDDKRVKLYASRIGSSNKNGEIGEIIHIYEDGIGIRTKDGEIIITELQFEGKKKTLAKEYINGLQNKEDLLGKIF